MEESPIRRCGGLASIGGSGNSVRIRPRSANYRASAYNRTRFVADRIDDLQGNFKTLGDQTLAQVLDRFFLEGCAKFADCTYYAGIARRAIYVRS